MSRCFPFPPPGYETSARTEHLDSTSQKEKHKEKREKKEKRDREKREGKEQRHRDKNKDKHGDKKERKDKDKKDKDKEKKDKDREKKKDKDRTKDRYGISIEKVSEEQIKSLDHKKERAEIKQELGVNKNFKSEELGGRIGEEKKARNKVVENDDVHRVQRTGNQMVSNVAHKIQGAGNLLVDNFVHEIQKTGIPIVENDVHNIPKTGNQTVESRFQKTQKFQGRQDGNQMVDNISNNVQRRGNQTVEDAFQKAQMVQGRQDGIQIVENVVSTVQKIGNQSGGDNLPRVQQFNGRQDGTQVVENTANKVQKKGSQTVEDVIQCVEKFQGRQDDNNKMAEKRKRADFEISQKKLIATQKRDGGTAKMLEERITGNNLVKIISTKERTHEAGGSLDKGTEKKADGKGKPNEHEAHVWKASRHLDTCREKRHKGKDRHKDKEKKKEKDRSKEGGEQKEKEPNHTTDSGKKKQDTLCIKPSSSPKDINTDFSGNLKRKEINGFSYEHGFQSNKLSRTAPASLLSIENGKPLEFHNIALPLASSEHGAVKDEKVESIEVNKERKINGVIKTPPASLSSDSSPKANSKNYVAFRKPPHPDSKYLSCILAVPTMEEWPEVDDQEWLSGRDDIRRKPMTKTQSNEIPQVWATALRIEEADVLALPYVIPY